MYMDNDQRLNTEHSSFIDDINKVISSKQNDTYNLIREICSKYSITVETFYYRIRSIYGKGIRELRREYFTPSRDVLLYMVGISANSDEVRVRLGIPNEYWKGIYDRVLGVSTFKQAKLIYMAGLTPRVYSPTSKDNLALLAAARLGDGTVVRGKVLQIEHSIKQLGWLETKVNVLSRAYPYIRQGIRTNQRVDKNGKPFTTCTWWSGSFRGDKVLEVLNQSKISLVQYLTPISIWLLYLDDGNYGRYGYSSVLGIAVENEVIGGQLIGLLQTYDLHFTQENKNYISIKKQESIKAFMMTFCDPFKDLTPECMSYKTTMKI